MGYPPRGFSLAVAFIPRLVYRKFFSFQLRSQKEKNIFHPCLTKHQEEQIDAFHRRQLRKIQGIKYPNIMTNRKLYESCNERPLSITILEARWKLFGHILRRNRNIPANKTMTYYFKKRIRQKFQRKRKNYPTDHTGKRFRPAPKIQ